MEWPMMKVNLFISNFNTYRKKIFSIIAPVLFLALLLGINRLMYYLLMDDAKSYTRLSLHEMYTQEENIDVLFLGSSHCYRGVDPSVTDDIFDANTFNGGSSSQSWDGSYAILVEAGKRNELKKVYVEMYYGVAGEVYQERELLTSTYLISDYLRPSVNKVRYLVEGSSPDHWIDGFFPARRYWQKLFSRGYVANIIASKQTDAYKSHEYWGNPEGEIDYYAGKGYRACREGIEDNDFSIKDGPKTVTADMFSADDKKSIQRIIEYCEKNNIELAFFSSPMPYYYVLAAKDYGSYIDQVNQLLKESGTPYYDFNLCKEEHFSYECSLFRDVDHLSAAGGERFSRVFAEFFTGQIAAEDLFYDSYEEKWQSMEDRVYGVNYSVTETETEKQIAFDVVQKGNADYFVTVSKRIPGTDAYEEMCTLTSLQEVYVPLEEGRLQIEIFQDENRSSLLNRIYVKY